MFVWPETVSKLQVLFVFVKHQSLFLRFFILDQFFAIIVLEFYHADRVGALQVGGFSETNLT